jgi:hypothetical protein
VTKRNRCEEERLALATFQSGGGGVKSIGYRPECRREVNGGRSGPG